MRNKTALTLDDAQRVLAAALEKAAQKHWAVSIAIMDDGANLLSFARMDGAKLGSVTTAIEKARTAVLFERPTKGLEEIIASGRNAMLNLPHSVPIQGGLPLIHETTIVGAIGVSGVTSPEDEEVARAGAAAL
ncbi:MAG TPA: heme-binding protein [Steroidobacteraceae bacterium]|nr:heme-binding protein [Steroidobacteraceae bacterium]